MPLSVVTHLVTHGVAAFPPPGPLPSSFQFHHQGSNFAIFLILFALCMMEVVVLRIITEEQARGERGPRSVTSLWFELDDDWPRWWRIQWDGLANYGLLGWKRLCNKEKGYGYCYPRVERFLVFEWFFTNGGSSSWPFPVLCWIWTSPRARNKNVS